MKRYGIPYKGSKNFIAEKIVDVLPQASTLYDVFAGGCAVTHAALVKNKFKHYVINDLNDATDLFIRALNGEKFPIDWVSRDEFFKRKDVDPFVRVFWSFGYNEREYLYGRKIEPYKKACHDAIVNNDCSGLKTLCPEVYDTAVEVLNALKGKDIHERRLALGRAIVLHLKLHSDLPTVLNNPLYMSVQWKDGKKSVANLKDLSTMSRMQICESLTRMSSLQQLLQKPCDTSNITVLRQPYDTLKFDDPLGVIYCDPPYKGTEQYRVNGKRASFDYEAFYLWCEKQTLPVYISEYNMPEDRFICVAEFNKLQTICATKTKTVVERLYRPWAQVR